MANIPATFGSGRELRPCSIRRLRASSEFNPDSSELNSPNISEGCFAYHWIFTLQFYQKIKQNDSSARRLFEKIVLKLNKFTSRRPSLMYYVYIIRCEDKSLYTGITNDLERRFKEHKNKTGGHYTSSHKVEKIVHTEKFKNRSEALKREAKIKSWRREKKIILINEKA